MKALRLAAGIVMALALLVVAGPKSSFAAGTYSTGFQIQNLSGTTANVTITFYPQGSATGTAVNTTVAGNGAKTYATLPDTVAAGFSGGAVISSDQNVASIVNVAQSLNGSFNSGASYSGVSAGSKSVQLPVVFHNWFGFNTLFNVQNTGSSAAHITIAYSNGQSDTATILPGSSTQFDQTSSTKLGTQFFGSALITSDVEVAAAVLEQGPTTLLSYNGFGSTDTSTTPVFPLINTNNFGYVTQIGLQNTGNTATNVTVSYTPSSAGTACTETLNIPAKSSVAFGTGFLNTSNVAGENCAKTTFVGSAKVTANSASQPLVGVVNQLNQSLNKGGSYNGINPASGTAKVVFPIINDRNFGYNTGFSIMNVGSVATKVSCSFTGTAVKQEIASLAVGGTWTIQQQNKIADKYNGSGTCTATAANAKIVGVLNQVNGSATTDAFFVSNGVNN